MTASGSTALAAGLPCPVDDVIGFGWRGALGVWAVPAMLAAAGLASAGAFPVRGPPNLRPDRPSRAAAWREQVTIYFGLQSCRSTPCWPHYSPSTVSTGSARPERDFALGRRLVQIPVALMLPSLATQAANQVTYVAGSTLLIGLGLAGALLAPTSAPYLSAVLIGVGQGACFALGLNLFMLRARRVHETASCRPSREHWLQSVAFGPLLVGLLHEAAAPGPFRWSCFSCFWCLSWSAGRSPGATAPSGRDQPDTRQAVRRWWRPWRAVSSRGSSSGAWRRRPRARARCPGPRAAARNASQLHHSTDSDTSSGAERRARSSRRADVDGAAARSPRRPPPAAR